MKYLPRDRGHPCPRGQKRNAGYQDGAGQDSFSHEVLLKAKNNILSELVALDNGQDLDEAILFPGRRKVEKGWRGEGAPRPRAAAWPRARPGKSRDRTPPETGLTPEKELLTISDRLAH
jgi:hypothetical protein